MRIPFFSKVMDERFLNHRLRSTSLGGIIGGALAMMLFAYHYYVGHIWSWDLLAVGITMVVVKWTVLIWYRITD